MAIVRLVRSHRNREASPLPEKDPKGDKESTPEDDNGKEDAAPKDDPRVPTTGVAKDLADMMGADAYAARVDAVLAARQANPELADIPVSALAALRGYTEKSTETALAGKVPQYRYKDDPLPDMTILNSALRSDDKETIAKTAQYIRSVMEALEAIPSRRALVYRGVRLRDAAFKQKLLGKEQLVFVEHGFGSTTSVEEMAVSFASDNPGGVEQAILVINSYSAKGVECISKFPKEAERLLSPGSRFIVWRRRRHPTIPNTWMISLLEVRTDLGEFARVWGTGNDLYATLVEVFADANEGP